MIQLLALELKKGGRGPKKTPLLFFVYVILSYS